LREEIEKRERSKKEFEKREIDEKYNRIDVLFGIREREKKYKRKMGVVSNSSVWFKRKLKDRSETIFEMT
jgi:hypothetical protein